MEKAKLTVIVMWFLFFGLSTIASPQSPTQSPTNAVAKQDIDWTTIIFSFVGGSGLTVGLCSYVLKGFEADLRKNIMQEVKEIVKEQVGDTDSDIKDVKTNTDTAVKDLKTDVLNSIKSLSNDIARVCNGQDMIKEAITNVERRLQESINGVESRAKDNLKDAEARLRIALNDSDKSLQNSINGLGGRHDKDIAKIILRLGLLEQNNTNIQSQIQKIESKV